MWQIHSQYYYYYYINFIKKYYAGEYVFAIESATICAINNNKKKGTTNLL